MSISRSNSRITVKVFGIIILFLVLQVIFWSNSKNARNAKEWKDRAVEKVVEIQQIFQPNKEVDEYVEEVEKEKFEEKVDEKFSSFFINCYDKDHKTKFIQHGKYFLLKNYVKSTKYFKCGESITFSTHGDYTFLNNLVPLLERWKAPISVALWAPRELYQITLDSIAFLRKCHDSSLLVQQFVSFHVFFETEHFPTSVQRDFEELEALYECPAIEPFADVTQAIYAKALSNLTYPVNVARNLAKESALTHFILESDFDFYPSIDLVKNFLAMVEKDPELFDKEKNVFVLPIFEVTQLQAIPSDKHELQKLFNAGSINWFTSKYCQLCHDVPSKTEWLEEHNESDMIIVSSNKRKGSQFNWEPIYIGTSAEPLFDERLDWEGKNDRKQKSYTMCLLDYNYHVLSNAFLVRKRSAVTLDNANPDFEARSIALLEEKILPETRILFGDNIDCRASGISNKPQLEAFQPQEFMKKIFAENNNFNMDPEEAEKLLKSL